MMLTKKIISMFAAAALLLCSFPFTASSLEAESSTEPVFNENNITIVEELVNLRSTYEKRFLMSDGSYTVAVYNEPVHYFSDDGWVEVDNRLTLTTQRDGTTRYANKSGLSDVSFSQSFQSDLVTMTQDDYSVAWGIKAIKNSGLEIAAATQTSTAEVVTKRETNLSAEESKLSVENSSSTLQYRNALGKGVDLEYIVMPSRVKENIILQSAQDIKSYVVTITTNNLKATLTERNCVDFVNASGESIFTMQSPYMYDGAGEISEDISVELQNVGAGKYSLIMIPSSRWLSASNRVYPVVIDPTLTTSRNSQNILDNYVLSGYGNQTHTLDCFYIGNRFGSTARAYIKFKNMPAIPTGSTINSAMMKLTIKTTNATAYNINAYKVTGANWSPDYITWDNMPAANTLLASQVGSNGNSYYSFSCLSAVQGWYTNSTSGINNNFGIMVRYVQESSNFTTVYSADCTTDSYRPYMTINFSLPAGVSEIVWPVPNHYTITSPWGYRTYNHSMHYGIDISVYKQPVVAAISGTISTFWASDAGYGMGIKKSDSDFQARYYHLKQGSYRYSDGAVVTAGTVIATSGDTGSEGSYHLHFQLQYGRTWGDKDKSYNPLAYYHWDDARSGWTNPNPMFKQDGDIFVPNYLFNYTYTHSDYNDTDASAWIG